VFSLFWSGGLLDAAIDESQVDEILKNIGTARYNLTEKEEVIAVLRQRESDRRFDENPVGLQTYLVLLSDQIATDKAVAEFRKEALAGISNRTLDEVIGLSPLAQTVAAIADLLWEEKRVADEPTDNPTPSAAGRAGNVIQKILANSPEFSGEVISWAKSMDERYDLDFSQIFRDWWVKNEKAFRERRYKDVMPGEPIEPFQAVTDPAADAGSATHPTGAIEAAAQPPEHNGGGDAQVKGIWLAAGLAATFIAAGGILYWRRKT